MRRRDEVGVQPEKAAAVLLDKIRAKFDEGQGRFEGRIDGESYFCRDDGVVMDRFGGRDPRLFGNGWVGFRATLPDEAPWVAVVG
jgi:hypothetical protein